MRRIGLLLVVVVALVLGLPVSAAAHETVEYYGTDAIGSVRIVFDASGTIVGRMDYGLFGEQILASTVGHRSYAGLFRDGEAGLDYAEARSYQVRTGRFSAPDPVYAGLFNPQEWNRFAYALNSPLDFVDPTGLRADSCTSTDPWSKVGDDWVLNTTVKRSSRGGGSGGGGWADFLTWVNSIWGDSRLTGGSDAGDSSAGWGGGGSSSADGTRWIVSSGCVSGW